MDANLRIALGVLAGAGLGAIVSRERLKGAVVGAAVGAGGVVLYDRLLSPVQLLPITSNLPFEVPDVGLTFPAQTPDNAEEAAPSVGYNTGDSTQSVSLPVPSAPAPVVTQQAWQPPKVNTPAPVPTQEVTRQVWEAPKAISPAPVQQLTEQVWQPPKLIMPAPVAPAPEVTRQLWEAPKMTSPAPAAPEVTRQVWETPKATTMAPVPAPEVTRQVWEAPKVTSPAPAAPEVTRQVWEAPKTVEPTSTPSVTSSSVTKLQVGQRMPTTAR